MFFGGDNIGAVVADLGSQNVRIGFAGEDAPRAFHNSAVGVTKGEGKAASTSAIPFTRPPADMDVQMPIVDGVIVDYDLYQRTWEDDLQTYLKADLKDTPVLLAEKPYQSPSARHKLAEMMFETFGTSALFISKDAVLSCYACGKTSGVSIDMGQSGATICPVIDGFCELKALSKSGIHGRMLDAYMLSLMAKRFGSKPRPLYSFTKITNTSSTNAANLLNMNDVTIVDSGAIATPAYHAFQSLEVARDLRETTCRTTESPLFDLASTAAAASSAVLYGNVYNNTLVDFNVDNRYLNLPTTSYELPDGTLIDVNLEKYIIPEAYFEPSVLANFSSEELDVLYANHPHNKSPLQGQAININRHDGLHKMIVNSVLQCDAEAQQNLLSTLVMFGGNLYENFVDRVKSSVEASVYPSIPTAKVRVFTTSNNNERLYAAWLGGSILASLGSLHEMWVSKKEYNEFGPGILDRKCP